MRLRRYGPVTLLVVVALVVAAMAVLGDGEGDSDDDRGRGSTGHASEEALGLDGPPGAPEPIGDMPPTYAEADAAGNVDDLDWGGRCDPATGSVRIPSMYAWPCVPLLDSDNGGVTSDGVTADSIRIVRYVPDPSLDLRNALEAAGEVGDSAREIETFRDYFEIFTSRAELYGRRIELVEYEATGRTDDLVAARADAIQIATELEPFAVIDGPLLDRGTFIQELSSRGIVCLDCSAPLPQDILDPLAPFVWSSLPSAQQFLGALVAWVRHARSSRPEGTRPKAIYAGDPDYRDRPRKVGIIHFDYDPPAFDVPTPEGVSLIESYVLDFATLPQKASEIIARFKDEEITTIVFLGDPITPSYLTGAATDQGYRPEWVFTGTTYTDTNRFGRTYDQQQMEHAYGISQQAAPTARDIQDPVRLYRWYFGEGTLPPSPPARYEVIRRQAQFIVAGIHMAGPDLTPQTFARGLFRIPPVGGGPTTPQISYGNWGFFDEPDYQGIDDSAEIWWDATVAAPDEAGNDDVGAWRRVDGGRRFIDEDDVPAHEPFDPDDTVTIVTELPDQDTPPDYPPPPGSPASRARRRATSSRHQRDDARAATSWRAVLRSISQPQRGRCAQRSRRVNTRRGWMKVRSMDVRMLPTSTST